MSCERVLTQTNLRIECKYGTDQYVIVDSVNSSAYATSNLDSNDTIILNVLKQF